jgi:hypothetical protein
VFGGLLILNLISVLAQKRAGAPQVFDEHLSLAMAVFVSARAKDGSRMRRDASQHLLGCVRFFK